MRLYRVYKGGKLGFIDNTGRLVIPPRPGLSVIDDGTYLEFAEGLARVEVETDKPGTLSNRKKVGFVDTAGRVVIAPRWLGTRSFSGGLAAVSEGGRYGYIDRTGREVIPVQFYGAQSFAEGLAEVTAADSRSVYIDKTGRYVWPPSK